MNKKFIFMTADIHYMGGMQVYIKSKIDLLLRDGWKVYILYGNVGDCITRECAFRELQPYVDGAVCFLAYPAGIFIDTVYYEITILEMLRAIEYEPDEECTYLIESHSECLAVWGEILAQTINAKHICFICNERFRGSDKSYVDYIDFFDFKYSREELAGISDCSLKMLFDGYKDVGVSSKYVLRATAENPVQDVFSERVEKLEKHDWNIAYIGRCEKEYFPFIIDDIYNFAKKHLEKEIQFIIVGNLYERDKKLLEKLDSAQNLQVTCVGYFSPIPRSLFRKLDVSIAGSGCCKISFLEGVPTIMADAKTYKAGGIFGYTVYNTLFGEREYSYTELLEDILVTKEYLQYEKMEYNFPDAKSAYDDFFSFVERSSSKREYYKFDHKNIQKQNLDNYLTKFALFLLRRMKDDPKLRSSFAKRISLEYGKEIGLFGYGVVGQELESAIPELIFKKVYDNHNESSKIEKPTERNINEVSVMLISPIKAKKEIVDEIAQQNYKGKIVLIDELISEFYYDNLKGSNYK